MNLTLKHVIHMEDWQHFLFVSVGSEGFRVSTKSFLFRFEKRTGQNPEELVFGLDQVFKSIRWSKKRGPIFGHDELELSPDTRHANASVLDMYSDAASPTTNEGSLLRENNVYLHAVEVLTIGGEWKIIKAFFSKGSINCSVSWYRLLNRKRLISALLRESIFSSFNRQQQQRRSVLVSVTVYWWILNFPAKVATNQRHCFVLNNKCTSLTNGFKLCS